MSAARKMKMPHLDGHLDAAQQFFFARELEAIEQRRIQVDYAARKVRQLFPPNRSVPAGSKSYTFRQWDRTGIAKAMSDGGNDVPRADAFGVEVTSGIEPYALGYGYTFNEIRSAALADQKRPGGQSLDQMRANACTEGFEDAVEQVGISGLSRKSILGALNQPNVPTFTVPAGAGGGTAWTTKTPDEIIADITNFHAFIAKLTKQVERMQRLLLPTSAYEVVVGTPRSSQSDTSIAEWVIRSQATFKEIDTWVALDGAGAGSTDRMMGYTPDDMKVGLVIPMEQTAYPPQVDGLEVVVNTEGELGGIVFFKPASACYADGV